MTQKPLKLITRKQAAEIAGVHVRTIDYYRERDYLTTYRERGFHVRIDENELREFLATAPEPPASASA